MAVMSCVNRGKRDDIDEEDDQESYFRYMEENPTAGLLPEEEENIDYDEDGNPIIPDKKVRPRRWNIFFCWLY